MELLLSIRSQFGFEDRLDLKCLKVEINDDAVDHRRKSATDQRLSGLTKEMCEWRKTMNYHTVRSRQPLVALETSHDKDMTVLRLQTKQTALSAYCDVSDDETPQSTHRCFGQ